MPPLLLEEAGGSNQVSPKARLDGETQPNNPSTSTQCSPGSKKTKDVLDQAQNNQENKGLLFTTMKANMLPLF